MSAARVLGILAGGGSLPREIAEAVAAGGGRVHIVTIGGETDRDLSDLPMTEVGWAQVGGMLRALRKAGAEEMVIVGSVRRPDLSRIRPDLGFLTNLPQIARIVTSGGDDSVLSRVVRFFEDKGFKVVSPVDVAPGLLVKEGPLGAHQADVNELADIARGFDVVRALGRFDVGQAVVIADGRLEAIEGAENTDAMLARLAGQRRQADGRAGARRGVLVKRPKPRQEMRVDIPAIGPGTVTGAVAAGLRGIAVLAGGAIALERRDLVRSADAAGVFVTGAVDRAPADPISPAHSASVQFIPGAKKPTALADAAKGSALLQALAPYRGSAGVVIDRGHVLAIECGEGIAALIARSGRLRQWGRRRWSRRSAMVVVSEAAGDLVPVVEAAAAARLAGVVAIERNPQELQAAGAAARRYGVALVPWPWQGGRA